MAGRGTSKRKFFPDGKFPSPGRPRTLRQPSGREHIQSTQRGLGLVSVGAEVKPRIARLAIANDQTLCFRYFKTISITLNSF